MIPLQWSDVFPICVGVEQDYLLTKSNIDGRGKIKGFARYLLVPQVQPS